MNLNIIKALFRLICMLLAFLLVENSILMDSGFGQLQAQETPFLPAVRNNIIGPSAAYSSPLLRGIRIHPNKPFEFDFMVDGGSQSKISQDQTNILVKYFLTFLTVPEEDLWVNLSPYEKDRIIPAELSLTDAGNTLLLQDKLLKQLSSSLTYPETELGSKFWKQVYQKVQDKYGATDISVNTYNKVWIVPDKAIVYDTGNSALIGETHLKVMMEEDYLSLTHHQENPGRTHSVASKITKEIILPELEKEVNTGKHFAALRQMFHSLILADWYKRLLIRNVISEQYVNKRKISGVDDIDKKTKDSIYTDYLSLFKKGAYNYIREDVDPITQHAMARKYFSGGCNFAMSSIWLKSLRAYDPLTIRSDLAQIVKGSPLGLLTVRLNPIGNSVNSAQTSTVLKKTLILLVALVVATAAFAQIPPEVVKTFINDHYVAIIICVSYILLVEHRAGISSLIQRQIHKKNTLWNIVDQVRTNSREHFDEIPIKQARTTDQLFKLTTEMRHGQRIFNIPRPRSDRLEELVKDDMYQWWEIIQRWHNDPNLTNTEIISDFKRIVALAGNINKSLPFKSAQMTSPSGRYQQTMFYFLMITQYTYYLLELRNFTSEEKNILEGSSQILIKNYERNRYVAEIIDARTTIQRVYSRQLPGYHFFEAPIIFGLSMYDIARIPLLFNLARNKSQERISTNLPIVEELGRELGIEVERDFVKTSLEKLQHIDYSGGIHNSPWPEDKLMADREQGNMGREIKYPVQLSWILGASILSILVRENNLHIWGALSSETTTMSNISLAWSLYYYAIPNLKFINMASYKRGRRIIEYVHKNKLAFRSLTVNAAQVSNEISNGGIDLNYHPQFVKQSVKRDDVNWPATAVIESDFKGFNFEILQFKQQMSFSGLYNLVF